MKQVLITIIMLAIALVLVIGVVMPILERGKATGGDCVNKGEAEIARIGKIITR